MALDPEPEGPRRAEPLPVPALRHPLSQPLRGEPPAPPPPASGAPGVAADPRAEEVDALERRGARKLRCRQIIEVGPLLRSAFTDLLVFHVTAEPTNVLVVSESRKNSQKSLRELREALVRCQQTGGTVDILRSGINDGWGTRNDGPYYVGGAITTTDAVKVEPAGDGGPPLQ